MEFVEFPNEALYWIQYFVMDFVSHFKDFVDETGLPPKVKQFLADHQKIAEELGVLRNFFGDIIEGDIAMLHKAGNFVKYGLIGDKMIFDEYVAPMIHDAWLGDKEIFDQYISPFIHDAWLGDKEMFRIANEWVQAHRMHLGPKFLAKKQSQNMVDVLPFIKDDLKQDFIDQYNLDLDLAEE